MSVLHAFEGCGLEVEYMLVERAGLDVAPLADQVLQHMAGAAHPVNDCLRGELGWSNELVMHVMELKNTRPTADLARLARVLHEEVLAMNGTLDRVGARLMPGGMHPWMDPARETVIWPHEHASIYRAYDQVFDCRTHGWANLQSTHVNLPFHGGAEFARLYAAVRTLLPILPALAAASPYRDGRHEGVLDARMDAYRRNADAVPEMNGAIVPEVVLTQDEYEREVLQPIYRALEPHDPDGVLRHEWVNARGAIARFERSALEIRVLDVQECPHVDVAFAALICDLAQSLYERQFAKPARDTQLSTRLLADIFLRCVHEADRARIDTPEFLALFGVRRAVCSAGELWTAIAERLDRENARYVQVWRGPVEFALARGPLARRLLRAIGPRPDRAALHELYAALCDALLAGKPFDP